MANNSSMLGYSGESVASPSESVRGKDQRGRGVHEKDCASFVYAGGGSRIHVCESGED